MMTTDALRHRTSLNGFGARARALAAKLAWLGTAVRLALAVLLTLAAITILAAIWGVARTPVERPAPAAVVDDVTRLNPVLVARVITPTTTEEIVEAVRTHRGPIAIGGGRYSMGGQTATDQALHIDMRRFNQVLELDTAGRTITVQTGIRWRDIQERIDPANLSVKIMQTYSNFTVGGSLSVNVHGRYVGLGPLVMSVRSIRIVLPDGRLVNASPAENAEIFHGAIGGYGALGVITEATLDLAENVRVRRSNERMPIGAYREWFARHVRDSGDKVIFHNADIYPDEYDRVNVVSYERTEEPVTVEDRLIPAEQPYRLNRFAYWVISEWPGGKEIREHVIDRLVFRGHPVTWRNYEASYDVAELEPSSRETSTYVLQEYFVPVERFDDFVPKMREIFDRHDVNVINVSIRHALPDPGTLLAWAATEVFAFVVYYKQATDEASRRAVGVWTREMADAAISVGGSWYLPYQPHATPAQFLRAYQRAPEFFALKRRLDPENRFRNRLWDTYYLPQVAPALAPPSLAARSVLDTAAGYHRDEGQTYLTHPEWYIVYSSDEYAAWLRDSLPTRFPYVASIGHFWTHYGEARRLTRGRSFNLPYHVMLGVIGSSYSVELVLKGLYENVIGRLSGLTSGQRLSDEDRFAHDVAAEYGRFIHVRPWYEYPFGSKLAALWTDVSIFGRYPIRKLERRFFLTAEYGIKAIYANVIEFATKSAYGSQADRMQLVVSEWSDSLSAADARITRIAPLDSVHTLVATPRYDEFRDVILGAARSGAPLHIAEIAGNDEILLTGTAPASWRYGGTAGELLYAVPVSIDPSRKRFTLRSRVSQLIPAVRELQAETAVQVDHIYDY